jgi:signal transduction histidine kinase
VTDVPADPTFRERIGGRWAISWQAFLLTIPIAIAALVVASTRSWSEVLWWILVGLIAAVFAGAWVYLMHRTVFRHRASEPVPLAWALVHPVVTMAIAIVGTVVASMAIGLPQESGPLTRFIPTLLIGTLWSLAITLLLEARWRFTEERDALIERAVQQQLAAMQEADVAERIRESLREEISDHLAQTRAAIDGQLASFSGVSPDAGSAASELRDAAHRTVRPLSHELAQRADRAHPRPGFTAVLRNIVERQPFRPLPVSIIYVVTTGAREVERRGGPEGLVAIVVTVGLIWVIMVVANWAMRRWPHRHAALFLAGIAAIEAPSLVLPPIEAAVTGASVDWPTTLISVVFGVVIILLTSGFGSLRAERRDLLRTFATDVKDEEVSTIARSRTLAAMAREAASALHGPVQTKLVACAMAIEHAAASGDVIAVNQALVQARAVLDHPLPELAQRYDSTIAEEVERKVGLWRGLVSVTLEIEPEVASIGGRTAMDVGAVVEEGIANAIQHGSATEVSVAISQRHDDLVICVTDNGSGPKAGRAGLGSKLLDDLVPGWTLGAEPDGTRLTVRLRPFGPESSSHFSQVWAQTQVR